MAARAVKNLQKSYSIELKGEGPILLSELAVIVNLVRLMKYIRPDRPGSTVIDLCDGKRQVSVKSDDRFGESILSSICTARPRTILMNALLLDTVAKVSTLEGHISLMESGGVTGNVTFQI